VKIRIDFTAVNTQDEAYRQERIDELRAQRRPFKSASGRRVRNLRKLRTERALLEAAWRASGELAKAQVQLERAQADYDRAFERAVACVDEYLCQREIEILWRGLWKLNGNAPTQA
jgi:hypothetical protein